MCAKRRLRRILWELYIQHSSPQRQTPPCSSPRCKSRLQRERSLSFSSHLLMSMSIVLISLLQTSLKKRSPSCPLAGGQFPIQKDFRNPSISRLCSCVLPSQRSDAGASYPRRKTREGFMKDRQLPMQYVSSLHATDVFQVKGSGHFSLAPASSQELPEWIGT